MSELENAIIVGREVLEITKSELSLLYIVCFICCSCLSTWFYDLVRFVVKKIKNHNKSKNCNMSSDELYSEYRRLKELENIYYENKVFDK